MNRARPAVHDCWAVVIGERCAFRGDAPIDVGAWVAAHHAVVIALLLSMPHIIRHDDDDVGFGLSLPKACPAHWLVAQTR